MKPSHLTTPRTLDECYFDPRGQAIHSFVERHIPAMSDTVQLACFTVIAIATAVILYLY